MKKLLLVLIFSAATALYGALSAEKLNRSFGMPFFAEKSPWQLENFIKRNRLRFSGNGGKYSTFFRGKIFGIPAKEIHLTVDESTRRIKLITIYFSNRGDDRNATAGIQDARRNISNSLNSLLGKSRRISPDFTPARTKMSMWQNGSTRFFLEVDKGEFAMLHIQPPLPRQKTAAVPEKDFSENLKKNAFGDVYITNVPMVDQGTKGYCVPATFSRIFLYYGVNLDMHHLAKRGDSDPKEGTYVDKIERNTNSIRRRSGLKLAKFSDLSIKNIARHIDKGRPILWTMYSTAELNKYYAFSRANRQKFNDPEKWKRNLKRVSVPRRTTGEHVCLIIGYNAVTDEIAVTNSWGNAHIAPIWIPVKVAKKVSQNGTMYVFHP